MNKPDYRFKDWMDESEKFTKVPHGIIVDRNLTNTELRLWVTLASFRWNVEGSKIYPTRETVAKVMGWSSKDTVTQYYGNLEEKGYLKYVEKGDGRSTSEVELYFSKTHDTPWDSNEGEGVEESATGDRGKSSSPPEQDSTVRLEDDTPHNKTNSNKTKGNKTKNNIENNSADKAKEVFNYFNDKAATKDHKEFYGKMRVKVEEALDHFNNLDDIKTGIDNYCEVLSDDDKYYFDRKIGLWGLAEDLERLEKFVDGPDNYRNFDYEEDEKDEEEEDTRGASRGFAGLKRT